MSDRIERIQRALSSLQAAHIALRDDSAKHRGHAGAQDGRGHFALEIVSESFRGLSALARHRKVYAALGDLMHTDIHALQISAKLPEENQ
ncbi:MAG: transcriptional regulator BolA [Alphaproteobacteria bacterium ADurb.BinA280]|jgi:BolA protein|nr:BolA family transcriptional regulator [Xanthomonadales bacterium]MCC6504573.1 BolA family transcriptional regulator [Aquimonas sp.]OPZ11272.1 MAG: transcriptional regulator BolA [Alphaproteobacteria bacterium ADurb.BinA280]